MKKLDPEHRWDHEVRHHILPTAEDMKEYDEVWAGLEGECATELRALAVVCENDARTHMGTGEGFRRIKPLKCFMLHFGTYQTVVREEVESSDRALPIE